MDVNKYKLLSNCLLIYYNNYTRIFSKDIRKVESELRDKYGNKFKEEIKLIISYAITARMKGTDKLKYSRTNASFTGTKISRNRLKALIDLLVEDGYVLSYVGGVVQFDPMLDVILETKPSIMIILDKFFALVDEHCCKIAAKDFVKMNKSDFVVVKREGKLLQLKNKMKSDMEDFITMYNTLLEDKDISVDLVGNGNRIQLNNIMYKRSFTNDLQHGGRYYDVTGFMSTLPQNIRKTIQIDGEDVCELDFSCLHPLMLYQMEGAICEDDFSPYDVSIPPNTVEVDETLVQQYREVTGDDKYDPVRNLLKLCMLCCLNAPSKQNASCAVFMNYNSEKRHKWGAWIEDPEDNSGLKFYGITRLISPLRVFKALENHNSYIEGSFYTGVGLELQRLDSDIATYVLEHFSEKEEVVFSWHDSFMVKKSLESELMSTMREAFEFVMNADFNCRIDKKY